MGFFQNEYKELCEQMEDFAALWFGHAADNYEVNLVIGLKSQLEGGRATSEGSKYSRLIYALQHHHPKVVPLAPD